MNDIRRTILWVIFGFSMISLWDQWQVYNGHNPTFGLAPTTKVAANKTTPAAANATTSATPAASASVPNATNPIAPQAINTPATAQNGNVNVVAVPELPKQRFEVTTDVLKLTFDTEGGSLVRSEFLKHADMDNNTKGVVLLDDSKDRVYMAQTGLIGAANLPTHKTVMAVAPGARNFEGNTKDLKELIIKFESPEAGGVKLVKTYTLKRDGYDIAVKHEVVNTSSAPVAPQLYLQILRDGNKLAGESSFYSTFTGPAVYTEAKKFQKIEFTDIDKNKVDAEKQASNGFVAMVQHYFVSSWILPDGIKRDLFTRKVDTNLYAVGMITALDTIAAGASKTIESRFFVGPQVEKTLETITPGLELVKDYGWLTMLAKPLYWLLDALHKFIGNWGWAIIALVLLLKIAFYWLNAKAYSSMAKMKAVNPRITAMRERLKDKPQEMQQEMMKIYREEKINPMGGCFPIMVQIPVFIALYWVLLSSVEMRNAPWIMWIRDLASPDPYYILPVVMTLTTMLQTALNPAPPDPLQAKMMWFMPLAFSVMFFFFPSGLVLYWITNNILSIAQQWLINTRMGVPPQFNLPKFK
ncbi:MAG TPA: membrane protein insertase YidC [Burkholderiaceae bacterium]|nr:membrane protein insertase YidC [Burkholderiaceae bacterium]